MSTTSKTVSVKGSIILDPSRPPGALLSETEELLKKELRQRENEGGLLLEKIKRKNCNAGQKHAFRYEDVCKEIVEVTLEKSFKDHVVSFHPKTLKIEGRKQSIRDISFPNHPVDTSPSCIWNVLNVDYGVRSFVLECKNYLKAKITSEEVYQLYEYMDPDEHGRLGFFLTRLGERSLDKSARSSIVRLKKDRYKFIVLNDDDLIEWINDYITQGSPETFFNKINDKNRGWI